MCLRLIYLNNAFGSNEYGPELVITFSAVHNLWIINSKSGSVILNELQSNDVTSISYLYKPQTFISWPNIGMENIIHTSMMSPTCQLDRMIWRFLWFTDTILDLAHHVSYKSLTKYLTRSSHKKWWLQIE